MEKSVCKSKEKVSKYIPDDAAFSILSKLPIKSCKRFECVCKSWFENHHFITIFRTNFLFNLHSSYNEETSIILKFIDNELNQDVFYSLSGQRFENKVKLDFSTPFETDSVLFGFGSINGICCLHLRCWKLVLWNPSTQEFKFIPPSLIESSVSYLEKYTSCVMFDLQGFGYDRVRDDYKLIRGVYSTNTQVLLEKPSLDSSWEIYSLRSNSWRKLDVDIPPSWPLRPDTTQVYVDGVCHWLGKVCYPSLHKYKPRFGPCLASFNLSDDAFFTTAIPSDIECTYDVEIYLLNLVVLNGFITLISYHGEGGIIFEGNISFHISILGELGRKGSWIKLWIIGPLTCVERPIGMGMQGEIFFVKRNDKELTSLVWFDLSTQMIHELGFTGELLASRINIHQKSVLPIERTNN